MKKNVSKLLLSAFTMLIVLSLISSINVTAVETPDQTIEVQGDAIQTQLQSNLRTMFIFSEKTKLTVSANIGLELDINCQALRIGDKDVIIEVEGNDDLRMTMTCTSEETQLGLMSGSLNRVRNRNVYRYLEGFCITMECTPNYNCQCKCDPDCVGECQCKCDPDCVGDCQCKCDPDCVGECQCKCDPDCVGECQCKCDPDCHCNSECPYDGVFLKARLRIKATDQNLLGQWACYDYENEEWVTAPTINQDGYLTAETNVLATWTLLVPEVTTSAIVGTVAIASVSALGILSLSVFYLKKRH